MNIKQLGYGQKFDGVLVDTNLLLLVLVGAFNPFLIQKFKRTLKYDTEDYRKLTTIISNYNNLIYTTPNILTEITNLTDNDIINKGSAFYKFLLIFIDQFIEVVNDSKTILKSNQTAFIKLGLADASIVNIASDKILVITDDLDLVGFLSSQSKPVINYTHLKYYS